MQSLSSIAVRLKDEQQSHSGADGHNAEDHLRQTMQLSIPACKHCAGRARLQPHLQPAAEHARGDAGRIRGRTPDALPVRQDGPGEQPHAVSWSPCTDLEQDLPACTQLPQNSSLERSCGSGRLSQLATNRGQALSLALCSLLPAQACAFGCRPVEMTYDGDVLHVAPIALAVPLHFVLVDLRAAKDTIIILSRLQVRLPRTAFVTSSCQPAVRCNASAGMAGRHSK